VSSPASPNQDGAPPLIVVGRVRRAHGIRGELVIETHTDAPGAVFAPGRRLFVELEGKPSSRHREIHVVRSSPFKGGLIVSLREISDRTEAERWRERYILAPENELVPPREDEIYIHDLVGMAVQLTDGSLVGRVREVFELPQGLVLEIQRERDMVMVPYTDGIVTAVDAGARVMTIEPPVGLLD
jgi:16S rRNA processing protein RimM